LESDRELISRVFGCGVFNQYASSEGAPPITQCFAGSMHINVDTGFFEFHEVAGDTSVFQLVVTSFRNLKVPLIRYRIGDVVKIRSDAGPCVCGSSFPRVDRIEGRIDDILVSTERGSVGRLDPVYKGVSGIERSQIVQEGKDRFRIKIVPGVGFSDETKRQLERNLRDRLGGSVEIVMEITDLIPLSANGKFRAVINDFSKSQ
jgi:phenylacetate-CoA ligase